jgi:hypothetical protein
VPVVFLLVAVAVLGGVFFAAIGRGGEISAEPADHAPIDLGPVSAPDIALLRPPTALWGYSMQVTDEALDYIARAMRDRDITIAQLQQELARRNAQDSTAPQPPLTSPSPLASSVPPFSPVPLSAGPLEARRVNKAPGFLVAPLPRNVPPPTEFTQPSEVTQPAEVWQPAEATQPAEVWQPAEATQPAEVTQPPEVTQADEVTQGDEVTPTAAPPLGAPTLAAATEVPSPQVLYDAHGWWAQQEEAAREEAERQAQAKAGRPTPVGEPDSPAATGPAATTPANWADEPATGRDDEPGTGRDDDSGTGHTATRPNPVIGSLPSPPDDDAVAWAEEQSRR